MEGWRHRTVPCLRSQDSNLKHILWLVVWYYYCIGHIYFYYEGIGKMENNNAADKAIKNIKTVAEDPRRTMDHLYEAYEEMCFRDPTVLDRDDIYPRSKLWRSTDRYNLAKLAVLTEAVKNGIRLADTEAYKKFLGASARQAMAHMTWD